MERRKKRRETDFYLNLHAGKKRKKCKETCENADLCMKCKKVVSEDDKALQCVCLGWQHRTCIEPVISLEEYNDAVAGKSVFMLLFFFFVKNNIILFIGDINLTAGKLLSYTKLNSFRSYTHD